MRKILGRSSSINVRKVLWTCDELQLPYQQESWGAGHRDPQQPEFLALNPNGMVPVLQEGDFILWESNAICRYLANSQPDSPLYPADARRRADIDRWMDWQLGDLNSAWRYVFNARMRNTPPNPDAAQLAEGERQWNHAIGILAQQLAHTGAHVTGAHFTLADIVLGLSLHRWMMTPLQRPHWPALEHYYDRLRERPAFARYACQQWP